MTRFFEVTERDGAARIGVLRLPADTVTPCLIDSEKTAADSAGLSNEADTPVFFAGSLWRGGTDHSKTVAAAIEKMNACDPKTLLVLPYARFSLFYPEHDACRMQEKIMADIRNAGLIKERPTAKVIRPRFKKQKCLSDESAADDCAADECVADEYAADDCDAPDLCAARECASVPPIASPSDAECAIDTDPCDVFIMEGAGTLENDAFGFFEAVFDIRRRIPFDAALWLPNTATPENAAVLVYLGADIFDTTAAVIAAYGDRYMTTAGTFFLEDMTELPCRCAACAGKTVKDVRAMEKERRAALLKEHNINALEAELSLVREKIRGGVLREYVEGQCRTKPWLTGLLRLFDRSALSEETAAVFRRNTMLAATSESQTRAEIRRFADRVCTRYDAPDKDILVIFPCAAKKPYSLSNSHRRFIRAIDRNRRYVNEIIITSPIGVVPRELELTYPAAHYDTTVTGHWDLEERAWVGSLLEKYLLKKPYKAVIAHVEGPYREICEAVSEKTNIPMIFTSEASPSSRESLQNLRRTLDDIVRAPENTDDRKKPTLRKRSYEQEKSDLLRAIARYQLGDIADALFTEKTVVRGNFPKMQLYDGKEQIATLVPPYGMLAFSMKAAEMIISSPLYHGQYTVTIDDFLPKGSLLAPGVVSADDAIRPGDDVLIKGPHALGVGKAVMSGPEMGRATKGVAVLPRHTKKYEF